MCKKVTREEEKEAFTLVELLVVIGIIALLIAILMPALSRARKQALAVSCASNARQLTLATLCYANDWKEKFPNAYGSPAPGWYSTIWLNNMLRLPIIGYDTTTVWTPGINSNPVAGMQYGNGNWGYGVGIAYVFRDYLKNDFDVAYCPDGWWEKNGVLFGKDFYFNWHSGYLYLPHRSCEDDQGYGANRAQYSTDRCKDVAKTASDKPDLMIWADFNLRLESDGDPWDDKLACNHLATQERAYPSWAVAQPGTGVLWGSWPGGVGVALPTYDEYDPDRQPLGVNRSRIDCRTEWVPWQDCDKIRFMAPWDSQMSKGDFHAW